MTADIREVDTRGSVRTRTSRPMLDYYVIFPEGGTDVPEGIAVEEFVLADDCTTIGLNSAGWTADGGWWSSAAFTRAMRGDPSLRARVAPVRRGDAESVYRRTAAEELPDEATLRTRFQDHAAFPDSAPLVLGTPEVPEGFRDKRVYRVLFAKDLTADGLAHLQKLWQLTLADDIADPAVRVVGTAQLRLAGDEFTWDLRRIGPGVAWSVDVTACLADRSGLTIGPLLRGLTQALREEGLIPVTTERFS